MKLLLPALLGLTLMTGLPADEPDAEPKRLPEITEVQGIPPTDKSVATASLKSPLVINTAEEAAKYFDQEELQTIESKLTFSKQMLVIVAWKGSGQDKLSYSVAESFPPQVFFQIERGRTRDLRSHFKAYAVLKPAKIRGVK